MATTLEKLRDEINHPNNQDVPIQSLKDTLNDYITTLERENVIKIVRVPFSFDTPDLVLTGIEIYTPQPDEFNIYQDWTIRTKTVWNGTTPKLHFGHPDDLADLDEGFSAPLDLTQEDEELGTHAVTVSRSTFAYANWFLDDTPLTLMVDNGEGADPVSTQGEAELIMAIVSAN